MGALLTRLTKLAGMLQSTEHKSTVLYPPNWRAEPIEIDDCHEVYGDNVIPMFPEVKTECHHPARYPADCVYDATKRGIEYRRCIWCKRLTG